MNKIFNIEKFEKIYEKDIYSRKPLIKNLTDFILEEDNKDLNVISINSKWGTGKTTFIKMWERNLKELEIETVYFNSWENDDNDNPLFSLIMQLEELYIGNNDKREEVKAIIKKMPRAMYNFGKGFLGNFVNISTSGLIDKDTISNIISELENPNPSYKLYEEEKERIKFKKEFKVFLEEISENKKIIFFIDELDRCRPNYAIKMLEVIKHYFEIKNITFILSIDMEQLSHSISTTYGENMDSAGYLKRFIDYEVELPKVNFKELCNEIISENNDESYLLNIFINYFNFSLRDLEKLQNISRGKKLKEKLNTYGLEKPVYLIKTMLCYYFLCLKIKKPLRYYSFMDRNEIIEEEIRCFFINVLNQLKNDNNNIEKETLNSWLELEVALVKGILKKIFAPYLVETGLNESITIGCLTIKIEEFYNLPMETRYNSKDKKIPFFLNILDYDK